MEEKMTNPVQQDAENPDLNETTACKEPAQDDQNNAAEGVETSDAMNATATPEVQSASDALEEAEKSEEEIAAEEEKASIPPKPHAKDLVFGFLLTAFGIFVIIDSLNMKIYKSFIDAPGFFPFIIGCALVVFGVVQTIIAVRSNGLKELKDVLSIGYLKNVLCNNRTIRVLILLGMMVIYIYVLLGRIHFILATSLYLTANFLYLKAFDRRWWLSFIVAVAASAAVYYGFRYGFKITLP